MKRAVLKVQAFIASCLLIVACSKHSTLNDDIFKANEVSASGTNGPAPMPPDTLALDTLNKPSTR